MKNKWIKFWIRIKVCYWILTMNYKHWFIVNLDDENFKKAVSDADEFEAQIMYHGTRLHIVQQTIKCMATGIDDADIILGKAAFEGEYEYKKLKK
jgi:hypothetical protein